MTSHEASTEVRSTRWEELSLGSGVVFAIVQIGAIVFFTAGLLPKMAAVDAPVSERAEAFVEHGDLITITNYLLTLPVPFFVLFLGGLFTVLRRAERGVGSLTMSAIAAGVAVSIMWPMGIIISGLGVLIANEGGDAATVSALDAMAPYGLALSAYSRAVLLGAVSLLLLESRIVPRLITWTGFALVPVTLLATGTLVVDELFAVLSLSTLAFEVWVLALSIALIRSPRTASNPAPQVSPA